MRILVLNYEFPPVGGGGGRATEDICRVLVRRGHSIRVQTSHVKGLPKVEQRDGYSVYRIPCLRRRADTCSVREMAAYIVASTLPALRLAVTWKPHVMHVHFAVPTGVVGWLVNLVTGIPYVLTAHLGDVPGGCPDQTDHLFKIIKPLTVPIWRRATAVTTTSDYVRSLALKSYGVPIVTIHNGVDFSRVNRNSPAPHQPCRMVFAGRFNPQKNLLFLIHLLKRVSDLDWHMDMLGDGPLMGPVKSSIEQARLADRVHLHGWVAPEVVDKVMSQCDVLLLPSVWEAMPLVGVKALGLGLAILGSDIPGMAEVVRNGTNGFVCPVNDAQAFEDALRQMLTSDDRLQTMKMESQSLAGEFDLERIVRCYEEVFEAVANGSSK